jgi:glucose/arabinose dehydrogenase
MPVPTLRRALVALVALAGTALLSLPPARPALAQQPQPLQTAELSGSLLRPQQLDFEASLLSRLSLPPGFRVQVFAGGLGQPRVMAAAADGTVYLTRRGTQDVVAIKDTDGDGRADAARKVVPFLEGVHGLLLQGSTLYLATDTALFTATLQPDGTATRPVRLLGDLPDAGQHPNRTLALGPDGLLYLSVGSTCNACDDANPDNATLQRMRPDGSGREPVARGLRNTIGFAWHPTTGELWGLDHGSDWRGDDQPPEELNRIEAGRHYGWPFCFADRQPDQYLPAEPKGSAKGEFCAATVAPVLTYQAHSAPMQLRFYTGTQFPADYAGDAFVTLRGSWNRNPASGYKVVRVRFRDGQPVGFEDFLTGFLTDGGTAHFGRLVGLTQLPDGSLLVGDDTNGVIYRVAYGPA